MQTIELNKADILYDRLKHLGIFSSVTVREIGLQIFYTRADRTVREWAEKGLFRRIPDNEAVLKGLVKKGQAHLAWYELV